MAQEDLTDAGSNVQAKTVHLTAAFGSLTFISGPHVYDTPLPPALCLSPLSFLGVADAF